jgi:hypothetical protein
MQSASLANKISAIKWTIPCILVIPPLFNHDQILKSKFPKSGRIDNTGHLVTLTSLDYEADPTTFNLIIRAKDTHSELTSSVTVSCHSRLSLD